MTAARSPGRPAPCRPQSREGSTSGRGSLTCARSTSAARTGYAPTSCCAGWHCYSRRHLHRVARNLPSDDRTHRSPARPVHRLGRRPAQTSTGCQPRQLTSDETPGQDVGGRDDGPDTRHPSNQEVIPAAQNPLSDTGRPRRLRNPGVGFMSRQPRSTSSYCLYPSAMSSLERCGAEERSRYSPSRFLFGGDLLLVDAQQSARRYAQEPFEPRLGGQDAFEPGSARSSRVRRCRRSRLPTGQPGGRAPRRRVRPAQGSSRARICHCCRC